MEGRKWSARHVVAGVSGLRRAAGASTILESGDGYYLAAADYLSMLLLSSNISVLQINL
jgi:hypothetical protein